MERVLHGVFLVIHDLGVLITGDPGSGKSRLGLELVGRGHALVADDCPIFRPEGGRLVGRASDRLGGFLHLRGLGLFNLRQLYGDGAVRASHALDLVIELGGSAAAPDHSAAIDATCTMESILDTPMATLHLDPSLTRHPGIIEAVVKRHRQGLGGYDAAADYARRQGSLMAGTGEPPAD